MMIGNKKVKFFEDFEFMNWGEAIATLSVMFVGIGAGLGLLIALLITNI